MNSNFFRQLKGKFNERQVLRWLIFTYPKTCLSLGIFVTSGYIFTMLDFSNKLIKEKINNERKFYLDK